MDDQKATEHETPLWQFYRLSSASLSASLPGSLRPAVIYRYSIRRQHSRHMHTEYELYLPLTHLYTFSALGISFFGSSSSSKNFARTGAKPREREVRAKAGWVRGTSVKRCALRPLVEHPMP
eukprot:3193584-Pyramimonas_sp.AAC.1